jgi:hypothetical protein
MRVVLAEARASSKGPWRHVADGPSSTPRRWRPPRPVAVPHPDAVVVAGLVGLAARRSRAGSHARAAVARPGWVIGGRLARRLPARGWSG